MTSKVNEVDLAAMLSKLDAYCNECDDKSNGNCKESTCLVGFGKKVLRFAIQKGVLDIPGAHKLIPKNDFKPYYTDAVAEALAETCKQCRECRENHSDDCVISLVRNALESSVLQEQLEYPGSVFMYLAQIKQQNPELAVALAKAIKN
ncbi:hypothetical protein V6C27_03485 [Peptococcaceae bacterium 1198_IL3148]